MNTNGALRPVTIVVPMYGDLPSLERCVRSVLEYGDLGFNSLLLVNDCGPQVEEVESLVLALTAGNASVRYERNERNLGFVHTCNRAVFELDASGNDVMLLNSDARLSPGAVAELVAVLALNEKHGVTFPRSNNASIASVPLVPLEYEATEREADEIYPHLAAVLPRYGIAPVAVGFCFLVRRELIDNYGFFDEAYAPGYSEENDFCLRINRFGYSSVIAHQAFVYHEGSKSFTSAVRDELHERNQKRMVERYTHYVDSVVHYLQYLVDPADWFADRLFGSGRKRVLIDLFHMSLIYNGSTRNALTFLEMLAARRDELEIDFVIVSSPESIKFFRLEDFGFETVANGSLTETFDLGFALSPVSSSAQSYSLNHYCVRWVVSHFDVIALRIQSLLEVSFTRRAAVLDSLRYADRVIPISHAALDDIEAYFGSQAFGVRERSTVIHEGVADSSFVALPGEVPSSVPDAADPLDGGGYVLVIGNVFSHKQFPEALRALSGISAPIVAFGAFARPEDRVEGVIFIEGGMLSDEQVDRLYRRAAVVVFPSSYEGFGLPIAETAERGRPLVVFDTAVGREVVESLGIADLTRYFSRFTELRGIVDELITAGVPDRDRQIRSIHSYNEGILNVLLDELAKPVDIGRLRARTEYFRSLELYADPAERDLHITSVTLADVLSSRSVRVARIATRRLQFLRPVLRPVARVMRAARSRLRA